MLFWNGGFENVAHLNDGILELKLCIFGMTSACRQQLCNRPTSLQDNYPLFSGLHLIENRQASSFEI